jgi:hypothetical protein
MTDNITLDYLINTYKRIRKTGDKVEIKKLLKEAKFLYNNMKLYESELIEVYGRASIIIEKLDADILLVEEVIGALVVLSA